MNDAQVLTNDLVGRPCGPVAARYALTYAGKPRKAAAALKAARAHAQDARQQGDQDGATEWEEVGDVLEAMLGKTERCRACGRELKHPASVARGIGPECWKDGR